MSLLTKLRRPPPPLNIPTPQFPIRNCSLLSSKCLVQTLQLLLMRGPIGTNSVRPVDGATFVMRPRQEPATLSKCNQHTVSLKSPAPNFRSSSSVGPNLRRQSARFPLSGIEYSSLCYWMRCKSSRAGTAASPQSTQDRLLRNSADVCWASASEATLSALSF